MAARRNALSLAKALVAARPAMAVAARYAPVRVAAPAVEVGSRGVRAVKHTERSAGGGFIGRIDDVVKIFEESQNILRLQTQ